MKLPLLASLALAAIASTGVLACSQSAPPDDGVAASDLAGVSPGKLRGTEAVSKTIASRLFADPVSIDAKHTTFAIKNVSGRLLAQASGSLAEGTATPISVTLWYSYASHVGDAFATACSSGADEARFATYGTNPTVPGSSGAPPVTIPASPPVVWALRANVASAIRGVCTYSGDRGQIAGAYFDAVMGPGSSMAAERAAFIDAFAADGAPAEERVRNMTIALVMNPYFVLER